MDFDRMLDAWRAQDDKPLYGVNHDLLQLVLQGEQARVRRALRWELVVACIAGAGGAAFAGFWVWALIYTPRPDWPVLNTVAAGVGAGAIFALWVGALWLSRGRQARLERSFGNTLQEEVRRNLSLIEYELSKYGRWGSAFLCWAPPMMGVALIYWLIAGINDNTDLWFDVSMIFFFLGSAVWAAYAGSREMERKLEPRRQRLRELLESLNASE